MPTKDAANYFYRSVGQICKVRKERYTRWAKVMDYGWEHGFDRYVPIPEEQPAAEAE